MTDRDQLDLFNQGTRARRKKDVLVVVPLARRDDPQTSHDAAASMEPHVGKQAAKIVGSLWTEGEGTIYEIGQRTGMTHVQVARLMKQLLERKVVELKVGEDGKPATRPGDSGRECRVWRKARAGGGA